MAINPWGFGATPAQRVDWYDPTTRTTFDTTTVTLAQLAERVKALIDDLRDYHGMLGA